MCGNIFRHGGGLVIATESPVETYTPVHGSEARKHWNELRPFVLETMSHMTDVAPSTTRNYLHAVSHFSAWALGQGVQLDPELVFLPERVEQYVETGIEHLQPHSRSTRRGVLSRVGRAATVSAPWAPPRRVIPMKHLEPPYSAGELRRFFAIAESQGTAHRRRVATAHLCLGLGAGLFAPEYLTTSVASLTAFGGVPVLEIVGERPRMVPVHQRYLEPLCAIAARHPGERFIGKVSDDPVKDRFNNLLSKIEYPEKLERPKTSRLRTTWMLRMLRSRVSLSEFAYMSGLGTTKALADLIPFIHTRDPYEWFGEAEAYHD